MTNVQKLREYVAKSTINELLHNFNVFRNQKFELSRKIVSVSQRTTLFQQVDQSKFLKLINEKSKSLFTNQNIKSAKIVYATYIVTLIRLMQISSDYVFSDSKDKINVSQNSIVAEDLNRA